MKTQVKITPCYVVQLLDEDGKEIRHKYVQGDEARAKETGAEMQERYNRKHPAELYFIESYSPYHATPDGISGAFVVAGSYDEAIQAFKDPGRRITEIRPALQCDIDKYGKGRSREEIIDNLTTAANLLRNKQQRKS